jgi:hypothetical protein
MGNVPAIPESTRSSITLRILLHAKEHWPQLGRLEVTCRGGFAYAAASPSGDDKPQPLFRLRYGGSAHSFGFAVYSSATGRYENSLLLTGRHTGTPQEALDTAATFYTAGITGPNPDTEPPKDLRSQPLSLENPRRAYSPAPHRARRRLSGRSGEPAPTKCQRPQIPPRPSETYPDI